MAAPVENWLRRHAPIEVSGEIPDGSLIGDWRVAALVARGGSGEVYRAVHAETGQVAALKILHRDNDAARARFALEIRLLAENLSPFLPAFYGSGEYKGRPWCAMEFLESFPFPSRDAAVASFVTDVCRAAAALHARGYVHRDIKPANVLSRDGVPVLIDLGLAKATNGPAVPLGPAPSIVDGHAVGVGTPGYSAPEQFTGGDISPAADIHAIGILASECFGGNPPLCWRRIIRRATSSLPSERYRDCAAMARAIRLRHWSQWTVTVLAAVAVTAVLFVYGGRWVSDEASPPIAPAAGEFAKSPDAKRALRLEASSLLARRQGEYDRALTLQNAANEIWTSLVNAHGTPCKPHLADGLAARAKIYCRMEGGLDAALYDMEKALAIRRELAKANPATYQPLVEKTERELADLPEQARFAASNRAAKEEAERIRGEAW